MPYNPATHHMIPNDPALWESGAWAVDAANNADDETAPENITPAALVARAATAVIIASAFVILFFFII